MQTSTAVQAACRSAAVLTRSAQRTQAVPAAMSVDSEGNVQEESRHLLAALPSIPGERFEAA